LYFVNVQVMAALKEMKPAELAEAVLTNTNALFFPQLVAGAD
jgi:Tat protein secretion system quality control protein TatD with DNase activity